MILIYFLIPFPRLLVSDTSILQEDMMILSVIEAYCFSARQRQTMNCKSFSISSFSPFCRDIFRESLSGLHPFT